MTILFIYLNEIPVLQNLDGEEDNEEDKEEDNNDHNNVAQNNIVLDVNQLNWDPVTENLNNIPYNPENDFVGINPDIMNTHVWVYSRALHGPARDRACTRPGLYLLV